MSTKQWIYFAAVEIFLTLSLVARYIGFWLYSYIIGQTKIHDIPILTEFICIFVPVFAKHMCGQIHYKVNVMNYTMILNNNAMNKNTLRPENVAQSSAIHHHFANMHNIGLKLKNKDRQSIFIYRNTIGAIFSKTVHAFSKLTMLHHWHVDIGCSNNTGANLTLSKITNHIINNIASKIK